MTFKVFHAKPGAGRFGFDATTFPDDFTHVATVEAPVLGAVFQLTNHIDRPWPANDGVTLPASALPSRLRSTSVGDVIDDGTTFHAVAPVGFVALAALDENFQTTVPDLYDGGVA